MQEREGEKIAKWSVFDSLVIKDNMYGQALFIKNESTKRYPI